MSKNSDILETCEKKLSPLTCNLKFNKQAQFYTKQNPRHGIENPNPGLGQTQICGRVKPVDGIPAHPHQHWRIEHYHNLDRIQNVQK